MRIYKKDPIVYKYREPSWLNFLLENIDKLSLGDTLFISREEWRTKTPPHSMLSTFRCTAKYGSGSKKEKYSAIIHSTYKTQSNKKGWYIKRLTADGPD